MWFKSGGAIEFGQALIRAGKLGLFSVCFNFVKTLHCISCRKTRLVTDECRRSYFFAF